MSDDDAKDHAKPDDTIIPLGGGEGDDSFEPFDTRDEFEVRPGQYVVGPDGLPQQVDESTASDIPVFNKTTLICKGDFTKFVIMNEWGEPESEYAAAEVERAPDGRWRTKTALVIERSKMFIARIRTQIKQAGAPEHTDLQIMMLAARPSPGQINPKPVVTEIWTEVEPIRPPCRHYARQKLQASFNARNAEIARLCTARRDTSGAVMGIGNQGVWACDMREPRDLDTESRLLDGFDVTKEIEGRNRVYLSLIGPAPELAAPAAPAPEPAAPEALTTT